MRPDDDFVWAVVETGSDAAFEELIRRHPEIAREAERRRALVGRMRGGRPGSSRVAAARPSPQSASPAWILPVVAAGVLVGAGALTFSVVRRGPETLVTAPSLVATIPPAEPRTRSLPAPVVAPVVPPEPMVRLRGASLKDAVRLLAARSGRTPVIAPGFPERTVDEDVPDRADRPAMEELGRRYGFTAFDQGDGTILVIPVREGNF